MSETSTTPPAAGAQTPDVKTLLEGVVGQFTTAIKAIKEDFNNGLKSLREEFAAKPPAADPKVAATEGDKAAPLTAEAVTKIFTDLIAKQTKTQADQEAVKGAVSDAVTKHLKGVPSAYHAQMPQTVDATQLETAATRIRNQYQEDLKAAGVKATNVGATPGAGAAPPASLVDASKLSPVAKIGTLYNKQQ